MACGMCRATDRDALGGQGGVSCWRGVRSGGDSNRVAGGGGSNGGQIEEEQPRESSLQSRDGKAQLTAPARATGHDETVLARLAVGLRHISVCVGHASLRPWRLADGGNEQKLRDVAARKQRQQKQRLSPLRQPMQQRQLRQMRGGECACDCGRVATAAGEGPSAQTCKRIPAGRRL